MTPLTSVVVVDVFDHVAFRLAGLAMFFTGGALLFWEVKIPPTHTVDIAIFTGISVTGLAFAFTRLFVEKSGAVLKVVGPYIPFTPQRAARMSGSHSIPPTEDRG